MSEANQGVGVDETHFYAVNNRAIYAAHSNYPERPMTSSVEIWDAATLKHIGTHSFGVDRGSLTWLDYHESSWWGTFANYNRVFKRSPSYANKYTTQVDRFADDWRIAEAWLRPARKAIQPDVPLSYA